MKASEQPRTAGDLGEQERLALRTARTICVALIVGVVLFGGVVAGLAMSGGGNAGTIKPPSLANVPRHVLLMAGLAGALLITAAPMAVFMRKVMLTRGADPQTGRVDPGVFLTATIVAMALLEAPALLGLVSGMIGKSLWPGGVVSAVAVAMMVAMLPRAAHFSPRASRENAMHGFREPERWK